MPPDVEPTFYAESALSPILPAKQEVEEAVSAYFSACQERGVSPVWPTVASILGVTTQELNELSHDPRFGRVLSMAKQKCEAAAAEALMDPSRKSAVGPTFVLKNMHGWSDRDREPGKGIEDMPGDELERRFSSLCDRLGLVHAQRLIREKK